MSTLLARSLTKGRYEGDYTIRTETYDDHVYIACYQCIAVVGPYDKTMYTELEDNALADVEGVVNANGSSSISTPNGVPADIVGLCQQLYSMGYDSFPGVGG